MSYKNVIRLIINFPLKSNNEYFELFKDIYFDSDLDQFVVVRGEASYFAILSDRQWYA